MDAILFEIEGVLAETEPLWEMAVAEALAAHGLVAEQRTLAGARALGAGARVERALRSLGHEDDETLTDLLTLAASRAFAARAARGIVVRADTRAFLERARLDGRVAAVTRASRPVAERILSQAGLDPVVEFVIAAEDAPPKPSPLGYERAVARLVRRGPHRRVTAVALEDSARGARAARAAGVPCVVLGGPPDEAAEADAWLPSLEGQTVATIARLTSGPLEHAG